MERTYSPPKNMNTFFIIMAGQMISIFGSSMSGFALGVWIFEKSGKATPFALSVLFGVLPGILLSPLAGSLADRWNRRWMMILADVGSAVVTLGVALFLFTGSLQVWHIYLINFLYSVLGTFQEPAFRASITMIVPKKDLGRASGLVQATDSIGRLFSPVLAGVLFVAIGLQGILMIDFISFFFAIGTMLLVRIPQPETVEQEGEKKRSMWRDAAFGWNYLKERPGLFTLLWYFALVNFFLSLSNVLTVPVILSFSNASNMGLIQTISSIGMLVGSLLMGTWGGPKRRIHGVIGFIALMGCGVLITGLRPSVPLISVGEFFLLFSLPFAAGSSQAIFQSKVAPGIQGRVFAIRGMIAHSMMPLANLVTGPLADGVFEPLLKEGGALSSSIIGSIVGVGPGRGMALLFIAAGSILLAASAAVFIYPRVRLVEDELPDAIPDDEGHVAHAQVIVDEPARA